LFFGNPVTGVWNDDTAHVICDTGHSLGIAAKPELAVNCQDRSRRKTSRQVGFPLRSGAHSVRSACITSTRAARAAGIHEAITAAMRRIKADAITGTGLGICMSAT